MPTSDVGPARQGALGEAIAALFLEARGYAVLARNVRTREGEIDLLVERGRTLVAVEVKWRRADDRFASAAGSWSARQRRRAAQVRARLLAGIPDGAERPWRFDLVAIEEDAHGIRLVHCRGVGIPDGEGW